MFIDTKAAKVIVPKIWLRVGIYNENEKCDKFFYNNYNFFDNFVKLYAFYKIAAIFQAL
jgi:hypothetical protein